MSYHFAQGKSQSEKAAQWMDDSVSMAFFKGRSIEGEKVVSGFWEPRRPLFIKNEAGSETILYYSEDGHTSEKACRIYNLAWALV